MVYEKEKLKKKKDMLRNESAPCAIYAKNVVARARTLSTSHFSWSHKSIASTKTNKIFHNIFSFVFAYTLGRKSHQIGECVMCSLHTVRYAVSIRFSTIIKTPNSNSDLARIQGITYEELDHITNSVQVSFSRKWRRRWANVHNAPWYIALTPTHFDLYVHFKCLRFTRLTESSNQAIDLYHV